MTPLLIPTIHEKALTERCQRQACSKGSNVFPANTHVVTYRARITSLAHPRVHSSNTPETRRRIKILLSEIQEGDVCSTTPAV